MTHFLRFADTYRIAPQTAINIANKLPAGTYSLKIDKDGYFLELIDDFELPPKLYGDCTKNADRIINTFWDRPNATGVFLEGEKGSGKTLLAKAISFKLLAVGVPTIVINEPHYGEAFNTFIQSIDQPAVVAFDEFEKIYSNKADEFNGGINIQERVLTLFDGVYPTKKLFIVTCNEGWRVDKNMKNRPGRMYYMLSFKALDRAFVEEYATENLVDKSQVESILIISTLFSMFNFDMLKALVEEMNRYGENAADAIKLLNTKPTCDIASFVCSLVVGGKEVALLNRTNKWSGNPLGDAVSINVMNDQRTAYETFEFLPSEIRDFDAVTGTFFYVNEKKQELTIIREKVEIVDWTKYVPSYE